MEWDGMVALIGPERRSETVSSATEPRHYGGLLLGPPATSLPQSGEQNRWHKYQESENPRPRRITECNSFGEERDESECR
jgi:hypothetical protein